MSVIITASGSEPAIGEAIAYLEGRYGIPRQEIQAVNVYAKAGDPIAITVTVFMQHEEEPAEVTEVEVTKLSDLERVYLRSDGTYRREPHPDTIQRDMDHHAPPVAADLGEAPPDRPEDARYDPWPAR